MTELRDPPVCLHGVRPTIEQEFDSVNTGFFVEKIPTYQTLHYHGCLDEYGCIELAIAIMKSRDDDD